MNDDLADPADLADSTPRLFRFAYVCAKTRPCSDWLDARRWHYDTVKNWPCSTKENDNAATATGPRLRWQGKWSR